MKPDRHRIRELFVRYQEGSLSGMDEDEFWGYVANRSFEPVIKQLLSEGFDGEMEPMTLDDLAQERILTNIYQYAPVIRTNKLKWLPYVAAAVLMLFAGSWFFFHDWTAESHSQLVELKSSDIRPGGNRAVLTLADGRKIPLDEDQSGIVLSGKQITYEDGNPLAELDTGSQSNGEVLWLELATPRGGTYQVTLPDGTSVWLNAGSVLRYPNRFDQEKRVVELSGEAYFDVTQIKTKNAKNKKVPFFVKANEQTIEVLGTEFNLSAYTDDSNVTTTLVEGSVRVASAADQYAPVVLNPNQQSVYKDGKLAVAAVDVGPFIAWKEGYFYFKSTPFSDVMTQLARWYDIELVYEGYTPKLTFSGKMSRDVSLQNVLRFFEGSGIKFTLVDGNLIIEE